MTKKSDDGRLLLEVILVDANGDEIDIVGGKLVVSAAVSVVAIPSVIYSGQKVVASSGTDEVLASSQVLLSGVTVKALSGNAGLGYVGPEGVDSSTGFELAAGEEKFIEVDDLASVWLDVASDGDGFSFIGS